LLPALPALLAGLVLLLSGCAGLFPPNYRSYSDGVGFSDVQVAKDTWEVSYVGPAEFNELQAKKMAILRAAELTRLSGRRWFRIVSQDTDARKVRRVSHEVTRKPAVDTLFAPKDAPQVVQETTTREDAWIPSAVLVFVTLAGETEETLDSEAVLREGRASGLLPKKKG
jgi:hypothetical protein